MAEVKFKHGYVYKQTGFSGNQTNIDSLKAALEEQANCQACGCSTCYGYWTNINTTTGELMMMYIQDVEDVPTLIIEPYDTGLVNVKALKAIRDAS